MIKFKELLEKSGAGDWGTDGATKTLKKGTPGENMDERRITDIDVEQAARDLKHAKLKKAKEKVQNEATDFRAGDVVHQVGSKLKGTVLHKGNQDKIVVKFGSVNKMIPASQLRLAEEVELDEGKLDKSSPIYKEYEALKKKSVADLRNIIGRSHRVVDLKGYDKAGAIRQILDDKHGEKKVDAFFGFSEEVELDEAQWGADNPYKKYKNDPQKLKRMLSKNQDAAGNMRNRIRKFMGSAPSGLKDELKDIENRIKQIKDVMRESVELDEEKVIKIVADTNTRKYKEGEVIKTFPETKAGLTRAMVFQKTVKDRYGAETTMVRESVELSEGAVAVSTVEKEIRKNGATRVKKSDSEITFMYKGSERKIPVDRGFVKSDHYMKLQDMMEEVE